MLKKNAGIFKYFLAEHSVFFSMVIAIAVLGAFALLAGAERSRDKILGIAEAHTYTSDHDGNHAVLSVRFETGHLVHLRIESPRDVIVGEKVCLTELRSYSGTRSYRLEEVRECT